MSCEHVFCQANVPSVRGRDRVCTHERTHVAHARHGTARAAPHLCRVEALPHIEVAGGLVDHVHVRLLSCHHRDGKALQLAARQVLHVAVQHLRQAAASAERQSAAVPACARAREKEKKAAKRMPRAVAHLAAASRACPRVPTQAGTATTAPPSEPRSTTMRPVGHMQIRSFTANRSFTRSEPSALAVSHHALPANHHALTVMHCQWLYTYAPWSSIIRACVRSSLSSR